MNKFTSILCALIALLSACTSNSTFTPTPLNNEWVETDIKDYFVGSITDIATAPDGTIYVSTKFSFGGTSCIYKSYDNGETWMPEDIEFNYNISCIKIDSEWNIYAGAFDENILLRKLANGTWELINICEAEDSCSSEQEFYVRKIATSPSGTLYIIIKHNWYQESHLLKSTDYGTTFTRIDSSFAQETIRDICVADNGEIYISTDSRIFHLHYPDESWEEILKFSHPSSYTKVFVDHDGRIYASRGRAIYISEDGGKTWTDLSDLVPFEYKISVFRFDDENNIYASDYKSLYFSTDNGSTWIESKLNNTDKINNVLPLSNGALIAIGNKLYKSENFDDGWKIIGFDNSSIECMVSNMENDVFAVTRNGTLYKYNFNKNLWEIFSTINIQADNATIAFDGTDSLLLASSNRVYKTPIDHPDWHIVTSIRDDILDIDAGKDQLVFTTYDGIVIYDKNSGILKFIGPRNFLLRSSMIDRHGNILIRTCCAGILRYTGDDKLWEQVNNGLTTIYIYQLIGSVDGTPFISCKDGIFYLNRKSGRWIYIRPSLQRLFYITKSPDGGILALNKEKGVMLLNGARWYKLMNSPDPLDNINNAVATKNYIFINILWKIYRNANPLMF